MRGLVGGEGAVFSNLPPCRQLEVSWETKSTLGKQVGASKLRFDLTAEQPGASLPPQIFWVGPLTGAVLASLIYNFILFPDTKTLAQRLAILTGTEETKKLVALEPQKESQSSSEDSIPKSVCQVI